MSSPFDDPERRREAGVLGMWVFLATEVLFFGAAVAAYGILRWAYPDGFARASGLLDWKAGAANTAVLLTSGLTMALAARDARRSGPLLAVTAALGVVFLVIKGFEYGHKWERGELPWRAVDDVERLWLFFYFGLTGLHAVHVLAGVAALAALALGRSIRRAETVEITGLYWHFVDVVWIFLFPLLYLLGRHR